MMVWVDSFMRHEERLWFFEPSVAPYQPIDAGQYHVPRVSRAVLKVGRDKQTNKKQWIPFWRKKVIAGRAWSSRFVWRTRTFQSASYFWRRLKPRFVRWQHSFTALLEMYFELLASSRSLRCTWLSTCRRTNKWSGRSIGLFSITTEIRSGWNSSIRVRAVEEMILLDPVEEGKFEGKRS